MTITARQLAALAGLCLGVGSAHADLDDIRHAAESGNPESQLELGILFQYGFNYKDNEVPALTWYTLAASQGNAKAAKLRDALMSKMSGKDIQEAMDQVKQYKPTGAALPSAPAVPAPAPGESSAPEPSPPMNEPPASSAGTVMEPAPIPAEAPPAESAPGPAPEAAPAAPAAEPK